LEIRTKCNQKPEVAREFSVFLEKMANIYYITLKVNKKENRIAIQNSGIEKNESHF